MIGNEGKEDAEVSDANDWRRVKALARLIGLDAADVIRCAIQENVSPDEVRRRYQRAISLRLEHDPEHEFPFTQFDACPPGILDLRVFDQNMWWVDVLRRPHRIRNPDEFADGHLENVIVHLRRAAPHFCDDYSKTFPDRKTADGAAAWLNDTVLMQALVKEAEKRSLPVDIGE